MMGRRMNLSMASDLALRRFLRNDATDRDTAQVLLTNSGESLAARGIRRLNETYQRNLGRSPGVIYIGSAYAVLPTEALLLHLGHTPRQSLLPLRTRVQSTAPSGVPP